MIKQVAITKVLTKQDILKSFFELGIKPKMTVEVHSSLSSLGYVVGGARTVVDALMEIIGEEGTILMPLQNRTNTEPSLWKNPPVSLGMVKLVREHTPAHNKHSSDSVSMGEVVDNFRRREGVEISVHPSCGFAAWGKHAKFLCNRHSLHFALSEESPLARLYELKGSVLLLGVDYDKCTMMHLGEYRSDCKPIILAGSAIESEGRCLWKKYLDIELDPRTFKEVGKILENLDEVQRISIGNAEAKLFRADIASAALAQFLEKNTVYYLYR